MKGSRVRAGVVLVFVFALGLLIGTAFHLHRGDFHVTEMSRAEQHEAAMAELRDSVGLDEEQLAQVHAIMAKYHGVVQEAWEALRPDMQHAMRQVHQEIGELLRPEQRPRYHEWLKRRHEQTQGQYQLIVPER